MAGGGGLAFEGEDVIGNVGGEGGVGSGRWRFDALSGFGAEITMDPHRARVEGAKSTSSSCIATS